MNQELLEIRDCSEAGYHPLIYFEGWRVAFLNETSKFYLENIKEMQRHNTSDEVFLLLEGTCTLYISDGKGSEIKSVSAVEMEKNKVYNVRKGIWHTHVTGPGAKIAIIENSEVSPENSEIQPINLQSLLQL